MVSSFTTLFDSDAFIGWFVPTDAHHKNVSKTVERLQKNLTSIAATNFVIAETATWLSRFVSQEQASKFLTYIRKVDFPIIYIDGPLQLEAENLFLRQTTKNISMVDCCNVVVMRRYSIPTILSFDEFYFKKMALKPA